MPADGFLGQLRPLLCRRRGLLGVPVKAAHPLRFATICHLRHQPPALACIKPPWRRQIGRCVNACVYAGFRWGRGGWKMEPVVGIEPTTYGLRNRCSATELHWPSPQPRNEPRPRNLTLPRFPRSRSGSENSSTRLPVHPLNQPASDVISHAMPLRLPLGWRWIRANGEWRIANRES